MFTLSSINYCVALSINNTNVSSLQRSPCNTKSFNNVNVCPLNYRSTRTTKHSQLYEFETCYTTSHVRTRATVDDQEPSFSTSSPVLVQEQENEDEESTRPSKACSEVQDSVKVLKNAAKTRKIAAEDVLAAISVMEKAKIDPSGFLDTLGGTESPGRTWMLVFTAEKKLKSGSYFPITAVQRFDAAAKRIENGVFFGPFGFLTFEGRFSWKKRILAFVFELIRVKIGPLNPFEIGFGQDKEREPSNTSKDPFFVWFYIDEEIAVARGRSGGTAFWCRCRRVVT